MKCIISGDISKKNKHYIIYILCLKKSCWTPNLLYDLFLLYFPRTPISEGKFLFIIYSSHQYNTNTILCVDFVAQAVYGGQPDAPPGSVYDILFDEGVRMGSWGLLLHSITGRDASTTDLARYMAGLKAGYRISGKFCFTSFHKLIFCLPQYTAAHFRFQVL